MSILSINKTSPAASRANLVNKVLNFDELSALLANMPADAFIVAFFIHSGGVSQDEWMRPLISRLRQDGIVTIGILTPQNAGKCDLGTAEYQAVISHEAIQNLERINVFVISDEDYLQSYPKSAKILGCCHGLIFDSTTSMPYFAQTMALLDGWICSYSINQKFRHDTIKLWEGLTSQSHSWRKSPHFHIIPAGYPRMSVLHAQLGELDTIPDSIVYAPVGIEFYPESGGNRLEKHGKRLIRILMANFPDLKVIFRPYKMNLDHPVVHDIIDAFENEARFILDRSPDRLFSFSRGALLVTDYSHIAQTFAFSTFRPAIYFRPWKNSAAPIRSHVSGFNAYSYKGLVEAVRSSLENGDSISQNIHDYYSQNGMPYENTFDDIAGWIKDFYGDSARKEWLTIDRSNQKIMPSEVGLIKRILKEPSDSFPRLTATASRFGNPQSALLFAFALHVGMMLKPKTSYVFGFFQASAPYFGLETSGDRYEDTNPELIRGLYSRALLEAIKARDAEGVALIESLLENFNASFPEVGPAREINAPARDS